MASQLGANLTGVTYVLDEPTIGLHPGNNSKVNRFFKTFLKNGGNTVLVVEHDDDTIHPDNIVDVGPLGELMVEYRFSGSLSKIKS
ncbi:MAG: hypothetical protein CM15mP106_8070 [Candidatus Neomarinimicrobiota bacterium]|nr:MAG: hypothetical protein CM15mP106_8070 [Candidatus Neomarinimicrobiota bacterium]